MQSAIDREIWRYMHRMNWEILPLGTGNTTKETENVFMLSITCGCLKQFFIDNYHGHAILLLHCQLCTAVLNGLTEHAECHITRQESSASGYLLVSPEPMKTLQQIWGNISTKSLAIINSFPDVLETTSTGNLRTSTFTEFH